MKNAIRKVVRFLNHNLPLLNNPCRIVSLESIIMVLLVIPLTVVSGRRFITS